MKYLKLKLSDVEPGKRVRKDMGDLTKLKQSMTVDGLFHPIMVTEAWTLISGGRRLQAAKELRWHDIRACIPKNAGEKIARLRMERDENLCSKPLTPEEAAEIGKELLKEEQEAAQARMLAGKPVEKFSSGRALDRVAAAVGVSRPTLTKSIAVVDVAKANPKLRPLVDRMNRTGKVNGVYREVFPPPAPRPLDDGEVECPHCRKRFMPGPDPTF